MPTFKQVRECERCGQEIVSPQRLRCECDECQSGTEHMEQCGSCGNLSHQPGPYAIEARP